MPAVAEKACLECTLPICDDRSKECIYHLVQIESRRPYFANYYIENRERKLGHEVTWVKCKVDGCEVMVRPTKAKSGYCVPHYRLMWQRAKRKATAEAVGELIQAGFEQFGGVGDAEPVMLRGSLATESTEKG